MTIALYSYFVRIVFFLFCISLAIFSAFAGKYDYGGVWSDETLEFTYLHAGIPIITGKGGNLFRIDGTPFEVEEVHKDLKKSVESVMQETTGKNHNVVVAGLTVIMRFGEKFEAYYEPLQETKKSLAFVSGSLKKERKNKSFEIIEASEQYQPVGQLQAFKARFSSSSNPSSAGMLAHFQKWEATQAKEAQRAREALQTLASREVESVYALSASVDAIFDESERRANSGFGSSVDSEQYLLSYLTKPTRTFSPSSSATMNPSEKIVKQSSNYILKFREGLLPKYREGKLNSLRSQLSRNLSTQDYQAMKDTTAEFLTNLDYHNSSSVLGYIFHLHSTNEICSCCATSIAEEILRKGLSGTLHGGTETPFILLTTSASQKMISQNPSVETPGFSLSASLSQSRDLYDERVGIGEDNTLEETDYDNVGGIKKAKISNTFFLQKIILEEATLGASAPNSSGLSTKQKKSALPGSV